MCDKILIAAVYLKVFNLNELLNILIYNTRDARYEKFEPITDN